MSLSRFFGLHSRSGHYCTLWLIATLGCVFSSGSLLHAEDDREYAEVSVDRYRQDDSLLLDEDGKMKGKALASYYLGLSKENVGDIDGALEAFERVLAMSPGRINIAVRSANLAGQFGDGERGRKILKDVYELNPDEPAAYLAYSKYLSAYHDNQQELIDTSLDVMVKAADKFPDNPSVYNRLISLYLTRRQPGKAQETLETALERPNKDPYFWLRMAMIAQSVYRPGLEDSLEKINNIYEKALQLGSGNGQIENAVADYYSETRQYERARDLYISIIEDRPEELEVRQKLARVYSILEDEEKELETLMELEQINPHRLETQRFLANRFFEMNDDERAIEHYEKALRIAPGTVEEYWRLGNLLMGVERYDDAVDLVERAIFHFPEQLDFRKLMGRAMNGAERYDEAFHVFKDAETEITKAGPDVAGRMLDTLFYFFYGAAAERSDRFEAAADLFRKSIEVVPPGEPQLGALPYNYLGYMWLEQDMNIEEAGVLIMRANELRPQYGAYVDSLGWYYFKKGDYKKSLETLLEALDYMRAAEEPDDAVVMDHLGRAYFELGHKDEAIDYLEKAVSLDPDSEEFADRLKEYREAPDKEKVPLDFLESDEEKPADKEAKPEDMKEAPEEESKEDAPPASAPEAKPEPTTAALDPAA